MKSRLKSTAFPKKWTKSNKMLRVVTANLNGIRSASVKGFLTWLGQQNADVVCVQELKAQVPDLTPEMHALRPSMTGILPLRREERLQRASASIPARHLTVSSKASVTRSSTWRAATCRPTSATLSVVSLYLPSGSSSEERQAAKFRFMDLFLPHMAELRASGRDVVICGDWNIAPPGHRSQELALQPEELRLPAGGTGLAEPTVRRTGLGRHLPPPLSRRLPTPATPGGPTVARPGPRTSAGASITRSPRRSSASRALRSAVYKDERFSDHAPLTVDYDLPFAELIHALPPTRGSIHP